MPFRHKDFGRTSAEPLRGGAGKTAIRPVSRGCDAAVQSGQVQPLWCRPETRMGGRRRPRVVGGRERKSKTGFAGAARDDSIDLRDIEHIARSGAA